MEALNDTTEQVLLNHLKAKSFHHDFIPLVEKILSGRLVEEASQRPDPGFSRVLHRVHQRLQVEVNGVFPLRKRLPLHVMAYVEEELQLVVVHGAGRFFCRKHFIDNRFVLFPKRSVAFPAVEVAFQSVEQSLDILGRSHGALIDLRVV